MMMGIRILLGILALSSASVALSVLSRNHDCPVCGKPSVTTAMMSYSNFGGPSARDQIGRPFGTDVVICPHDLYASWYYRWDGIDNQEKERLHEFLKKPTVVLTPEEKVIVGRDLSKLRESWWWELLWTRTCDMVRLPDAKHSLRATLDFYYRGDANSDEEWVRRLSAHYRDKAIEALAGSKELHRRYLRAELLRLAGRSNEAGTLFRKVASEAGRKASEVTEGGDQHERLAGLRLLCEDGLLLIEAGGLGSSKVADWLQVPVLAGQDGREESPPGEWSRNRIGLQVLMTRAAVGDSEASGLMWQKLSQNPVHLCDWNKLLEGTPGAPGLESLRKCGKPWAPWFDRLAREAKLGKLPDDYQDHVDKERLISILRHLGAEGTDYSMLPPIDGDTVHRPRKVLDTSKSDLANDLARRASESASNPVPALGEIIALLKQLPDPVERPQYGFIEAANALAKTSREPKRLKDAVEGRWVSDWWRFACEYALGKPGAGPLLAAHPLTAKKFDEGGKALESIAWSLFAAKRDPIWKGKLLEILRTSPWVHDGILGYATRLNDEEVDLMLEQRMAKMRKNPPFKDIAHMRLYEIRHIEDDRREEKMKALPVR